MTSRQLADVIQKAGDDFDKHAPGEASFAKFVARYVAMALNLDAKRRRRSPVITGR